jgi:tRNA(Ile)-lysidine synthase
VSAANEATAVSAAEANALFAPLVPVPALVLAVSGGPDSTALLLLAARWRKARKRGPKLVAVTVDHGLRSGSAAEARAVKRLAAQLGVDHRTLRWRGDKPATAIQEAARRARYQLLTAAARTAGARHILTAHTLDDQAETVLIRMARGSGLTGLGAMVRERTIELPPPATSKAQSSLLLVRPFLDLPKARLLATLAAARVPFAEDPSNRDPRFTRVRMRTLMSSLAGEGLDARRLGQLARRLQRADATIELAVEVAAVAVSVAPWRDRGPIQFDAEKFARLPAEAALRLLGRAVAFTGDEGPVQLGPLESLFEAVLDAATATNRLRRTLAGALVTLAEDRLTIERAPPRSHRSRGKP